MAKFIEVNECLFKHCKMLINIEQIESVRGKEDGMAEITLINYGDDPKDKEICVSETYDEVVAKILECTK